MSAGSYLITGGRSYLGSHLVSYIIETGKSGRDENHSCSVSIVDNIVNERLISKTLEENQVDTIILLLDHLITSTSSKDMFRSMLNGTTHFVEAVRHYKKLKKMVFVSSESVYGTKSDKRETVAAKPSTLLGAAYASCEAMLNSYIVSYRIPATIVRLAEVVYGGNMCKGNIILDYLQGRTCGSSLKSKGIIHINDAVSGIMACIEKGIVKEIYNISGYGTIDGGEEERLGRFHPKSTTESSLPIEKALNDLQWEPKVSLVDGLNGVAMNSEEKCNEEQPSCQEGVHRISESSLDTTMSKNLRSATQRSNSAAELEEVKKIESIQRIAELMTIDNGSSDALKRWAAQFKEEYKFSNYKYLIYCGDSSLNGAFNEIAELAGIDYVFGRRSIRNESQLICEEIALSAATHVIYFGPIEDHLDIDDQRLKLAATVSEALYVPWLIASICKRLSIHFSYLTPANYYQHEYFLKPNTEMPDPVTDEVSQHPLDYLKHRSAVQFFTERLLKHFKILICRTGFLVDNFRPSNPVQLFHMSSVPNGPFYLSDIKTSLAMLLSLAALKAHNTYDIAYPGEVWGETLEQLCKKHGLDFAVETENMPGCRGMLEMCLKPFDTDPKVKRGYEVFRDYVANLSDISSEKIVK